MIDNPWWMGLAPLLGWCLDAVIRTRRWPPLLGRVIGKATERLEFVMRTGMSNNLARGGDLLVLWIAAGSFLLGWVLTQAAYILGTGPTGKFIIWTLGFFLLIGVRRRASAASDVLGGLLSGHEDVAAAWLEHIEGDPGDRSANAIARETIHRLAEGVVSIGLLAVFYGSTLGIGVAIAVCAIHEIARYTRRAEDPDDPLWAGARRTDKWLCWLPTWIASIVVYMVIPLAAGSRAQAMAGFLNHNDKPPRHRLALAVIQGLGLRKTRTVEGKEFDPLTPGDIQRGVIVLWTSTFLGTMLLCGVATLVYWVL